MGPSQGQPLGSHGSARGKRILLAAIGSLDDLHPCIAVALKVKQRGHVVSFASTEYYRQADWFLEPAAAVVESAAIIEAAGVVES